MILDAVLLTLGSVVHDAQTEHSVAILPETRIGSIGWNLSGIHVKNPVSGYEIILTGTMDYAVLRYKDSLAKSEQESKTATMNVFMKFPPIK